MTIPEKALKIALDIAADPKSGYSQSSRWGPDFDCSSLVIHCYEQAGAGLKTAGAVYTGDLRQRALECGFKDVSSSVNFNTGSGLQKGDILLYHISGTNGHTAMYAGDGKIVHARGQSYGSAKTGDQGSEIAVTAYSRSRWQYVLRWNGKASKPAATPAPAAPAAPKRYAVNGVTLPIIKYGSVSRAVKVWQTIIGVEADAEFGKNTLAATLAFQRSAGLEDDGEVGPLTWAAGLKSI